MQSLEQTYRILTQDGDAFGLWRPDGAFRLMQEMAGAHARSLGFAREDLLREKGCIWMLVRVQLQMYKYPGTYEEIRAKTWYGPPGRITYPRYISVHNMQGERLAFFSTSWVVVSAAERRILPPPKAGLLFPPALEETPAIPEPVRIRVQKEGEERVFLRAPAYSDLDINGHMNNASYVSWVMDLFPMEWHKAYRIDSLLVSYAAEAMPNEPVQMRLYQNGLEFGVEGINQEDGHMIFEATGKFM